MKIARTILRSLLILFCLCAADLTASAGLEGALGSPAALPASLEVPANEALGLTLTAKGVQIYECRPTASDPTKYEWAFKAPEAELFDAQGHQVGRHLAGPAWDLTGIGKVSGHLKAKADAPDGKGVPWLLLEAADATGSGIMSKVRHIQRVNTVGGKAPTETATQAKSGQEARVEYTAMYKFFIDKP